MEKISNQATESTNKYVAGLLCISFEDIMEPYIGTLVKHS